MYDLTEIIVAVIGVLGAIITAVLVPYLKQKVSTGKLEEIGRVVAVAVQAAEMLYKGSGRGPEKKQYVYECINKFLKQHKMKVDMDVIENLIESAVLDMKNSIKPVQ